MEVVAGHWDEEGPASANVEGTENPKQASVTKVQSGTNLAPHEDARGFLNETPV